MREAGRVVIPIPLFVFHGGTWIIGYLIPITPPATDVGRILNAPCLPCCLLPMDRRDRFYCAEVQDLYWRICGRFCQVVLDRMKIWKIIIICKRDIRKFRKLDFFLISIVDAGDIKSAMLKFMCFVQLETQRETRSFNILARIEQFNDLELFLINI